MATTRIRTLNFLPEIFQTPTNAQFLGATLDVLVDQPNTKKIEGYVGSKFGYGINAKDYYVTEPTKTRTDYQLDPGVVFNKTNESIAQDFISYPGILDALKVENGNVQNNSSLFESEFYSWDSFTNLDKLINFNQYYWLPEGPERVVVASEAVYNTNDYVITSNPSSYNFSTTLGQSLGTNPTLTLLRGGTYSFAVNQDSQFWIQGEPGVTGYSETQPNLQTRDVYGVNNNGADVGVVTFNVPFKNAQEEYNLPGNNLVDVVATVPFANINGQPVSSFAGIDGVTSLNGLRVLFYDTGNPSEIGYTSSYFGEVPYDVDNPEFNTLQGIVITSVDGTTDRLTTATTSNLVLGQTITFINPAIGGVTVGQVYYVSAINSATEFQISLTLGGSAVNLYTESGAMTGYINQGLYEEGYYSVVSQNFYRVEYVGDPTSPVIRLVVDGSIPTGQKITATYGTEFINRNLFKNTSGVIELVPYISASLDTLYYQDGTTASKVGIIRLIDSNSTNTLDIETQVLGKKNFTSNNGIKFTNGLKVIFEGDVIPVKYKTGEYYVEGVGSAIELIPVSDLIVPEPFTQSTFIPWDTTAWDIGNWEGNSYIPVLQDYITIARNSINKNPWSRSNRWFHIDVINASAEYNGNPNLISLYATPENKAKRPIIEFYPNLKLFNSGSVGKNPIDFIDFRTTDAFSLVAGQQNYYPDVAVYTGYDATITGCVSSFATVIDIPVANVVGSFEVGQYVADSTNQLPSNAQITDVSATDTTITLTVEWEFATTIAGTTVAQIIATDTTVDNYALFDGSKVVFAVDTNENVRNKIYVSRFSSINGSTPIITLTEAKDGQILEDDQLAVYRGYNYQGKDFWYDGVDWITGQQKITVNQPPLFDVFDKNGISLSNKTYYEGSSFAGCKLFAYGIGSGINDVVLGFPIKYSSVDNVGDISFDVALNKDEFTYVSGTTPITQKVNTGYVFNYVTRTNYVRELGWQTAVAPSVQYQLFSFNYVAGNVPTFICDIAPQQDTIWPAVQVFVNNKLLTTSEYSLETTDSTTTVTLLFNPLVDTVIEVTILSEQVSANAYYTIPINLNNNPLNQDLTTVNVGDIRGQYQSIFYNNPNTTGEVFGPNNYRDLGNVVPWGNRIIQNSASLVLPGALLRKQNHNLFNSLTFNNREYIKFKTLLIDTVNKTAYEQTFNPSVLLDNALDLMTASKTQNQPFFWSDMLPGKAAYITNTYSFANSLDVSVYPLSHVYNFATANYNGILVYLVRTVNNIATTIQLIKGQDYTVSVDSPALTVTQNLLPGDQIIIKEYNQTYGSYCPNTPTKLGLYPASIPQVVLDSNYYNPTYFILGHDGSYNKLYGDYDPVTGILIDFRDQVLLEFEKRVYNNLKLSSTVPIQEFEILPGNFRSTTEEWNNFINIYRNTFLDWVGTNRVDYKTQFYNKNNFWTFNYRNSANKLDQSALLQGYWRGIYQYFYDTTTPNTTPWEMLGYKNQPTWWETRYGPAPYTSDNLVLWGDLAAGYDYNNGNPVIIPAAVRDGLLNVIPVNSNGDLISPFDSVVGNFTSTTFRNDWIVGDMGPTELSYRRSSSWPFDLMRIMALTKPAKFYNLAVDLDNYKYNYEFDQYLVNNRSHLVINNIEVYGNGTAKTSYLNWIVDYEKQLGVDATTELTTMLDNLDVRLVYRLAGFSDKTLLKFYVEKGTPNSRNASLLIPDESYQVLLYDNQAFTKTIYSGIVVQNVENGWAVYGNAQNYAFFKANLPKFGGYTKTLTLENANVKIPNMFYDDAVTVPYGTVFNTLQELTDFVMGYGYFLEQNGMVFDEIENGITLNWEQMCAELLYWVETGWELGSIITLNPSAKNLKIDKDGYIVQPLTFTQHNFILNENLYPIQSKDLSIVRDGTLFNVKPLNQGDTIGYGQFYINNFEHGIVFNNQTLFGDIIYNLITGLRQNRITVRGTKTAEWNGTITTAGFILNQDNIIEWSRATKYTKGQIVKYKNKYWTAITVVQAKEIFDERDWKVTTYDEIQKGLLPNPSTRAYESTLYYDVDKANLEQDADLLSFSLIGYRPRDYLALADLTDITQVNVYKNMIKNKGTLNAASAFKGANLPQGGIDYEIYENWAIKSGEFGGVLNSNFIEFKLNQNELTGNPGIVGLTNGSVNLDGVQQEVPTYSLFNYGRPISDSDFLPTVPSVDPSLVYPDAGYVNFNDVKLSAFYYSQLPAGVNINNIVVPINEVYVRDYMWLANYLGTWQVFTPKSSGQVVSLKNNLNNTVTITFADPHDLQQYDPFLIVNFNPAINGYYIAATIVNPYSVVVNLKVDPSVKTITGNGIGMALQSQRVAQPSDIANLPLLDSEFIKNKVWVDNNNDGNWAVYRKSINYQLENEIIHPAGITFGSAVAYTDQLGYLIGDSGVGSVYRYSYDPLQKQYALLQTITEGVSYGSAITYGTDVVVITEPDTNKIYIYQLQATELSGNLVPYQAAITCPADAVAISVDQKWLYASDIANNLVYVYRQSYEPTTAGNFTIGETYTITSQGTTNFVSIGATSNVVGTTFIATGVGSGTGTASLSSYKLATTIDGNALGLTTSGDKFGYSLATDYYGDCVIIGTPDQNSTGGLDNYGYTYVFDRLTQNIEVQFTSNYAQTFDLAWSITTLDCTSSQVDGSGKLVVNQDYTSYINSPIIFNGSNFGSSGISPNKVYYIATATATQITLKESVTGSAITLTTGSGLSISGYLQLTPLYVEVNGTPVTNNNYAIAGGQFVYTTALDAGSIINVSGQKFVLAQSLTDQQPPRVGVKFGHSVDTTNYATELIVGAPFYLDGNNHEGAVFRYTNGGAKYGVIYGTTDTNVTTFRNVLINGYFLRLPAGDATAIANVINSANISNVTATAVNGKLVLSLIDNTLAQPNQKLIIVASEYATYGELGISPYTQTQIVQCPHLIGPTQFGYTVKFNEFDSFISSAPVGTRYEATTFDFSDDELDNDTVFDNNATQFIDTAPNAGAVYMFDYLGNYNESLINPGKFVYAQNTNDISINYGLQPYYGMALDFNNYNVVVGTPDYRPSFDNGKVVTFNNALGQADWSIYRQTSAIVDIDKINNSQIFSAETNNTLINLDYIDPLQGKILGAARENIDVVSNSDPARYNNNGNTETSTVWGADHLGQLWLNTSGMRFVNYHQNDLVYNSRYWGKLFPNSDPAVYSWIASNVLPSNYTGPGTPLDVTKFTVQYTLSSTGSLQPVYYYWVRNTNTVFTKFGKTLADSIVESYIRNPIGSGISFFAPLLPNTVALYNCQSYINANDSVYHVSFATGTNDDVAHNQYSLIRSNFAEDFLPGLPSISVNPYSTARGNATLVNGGTPTDLYARFLDSLSGTNTEGGVVPDPYLPKAVQSGVLARPRQSFFLNRLGALKNLVTYVNEVLSQYPFNEIGNSIFLYKVGATNPSTVDNPDWNGGVLPFFDTANYVENVNWWAPGYDNNTKSNVQVEIYADLSTLNVPAGTIVTVNKNGNGVQETYILENTGNWTRIGLQYGTVQISSSIYDYADSSIGFGNNFWDTAPFDAYPSEETRYIFRAFCEELPSDLLLFRNKALILAFEYIQSETVENQNYLPWLNKTSFIDVSHTIRELLPYEVFKSDNQDFLSGYLNEIKPYHVVIKEFLFTYKGTDVFEGDITDFDLPAQYNSYTDSFITPELVYESSSNSNQFNTASQVWQNPNYSQWYNNYGLQFSTSENYPMTTLASYLSLSTDLFVVDNASGLPINGVVKLVGNNGVEEIGYSNVDYDLNVVSGLLRGYNGTTILNHIPGEAVLMDLPPVVLLNSGRGYINPPKITVYTDPEATKSAEFVGQINNTTLTVEDVLTGQIIVGNYIINENLIYGTQIVSQNVDGTYEINIAQTLPLQNFTQYVGPRRPAILEPVMGIDQVLGINVIDPGSGYIVTPVIQIEPASVVTFASTQVNLVTNTIRLYGPTFQTGDLVQYKVGSDSTSIGGVMADQWYYVNVLETSPLIVVGLYTSYGDAIKDTNRVDFYTTGTGNNHSLNLGAKAAAITCSSPVRENITTLRFDRTSYNSRVTDWEAGRFYGAYYAGKYLNSENVSSSSITLFDTQPPINSILASAQGAVFEIVDARNERTISYDSIQRQVSQTIGGVSDIVRLAPLDGGAGNPNASGSTIGFYVGMPVKFIGASGNSLISVGTTYYVAEIVNETDFKISQSETGSPVYNLNTQAINPAGLICYAGKATDTAILSVYYSGITTATATQAGTNKVTIPLNLTGSGGTTGFYTGLPVFFTKSQAGDVFGGIVENDVYYVTTVCDNQTFTMSRTNDPEIYTVTGTNSSTDTVTITELTDNLSINDPIIFTNFNFGATQLIAGQEYTISYVGTTDFVSLGAVSNTVGLKFIASGAGTGTGTVTSEYWSNIKVGTTYYVSEIVSVHTFKISTGINVNPLNIANTVTGVGSVTNQNSTYALTTATGNMTININLPVSPGQVNGQEFTLYKSGTQTTPVNTGTYGTVVTDSLVTRTVGASKTIGSGTYSPGIVAVTNYSGGLTNYYVGMPIRFNERFGNLSTSTTYFVSETGTISVDCTSTSGYTKGTFTASILGDTLTVTAVASGKVQIGAVLLGTGVATGTIIDSQLTGSPGNTGTYRLSIGSQTVASSTMTVSTGIITCDSTLPLYINMPIIFSGIGLGGVDIDIEYYVAAVINSTQFTITNTPGGKEYNLTTSNGTMTGTGEPYVKLATSWGGSAINPGNSQTTCTISAGAYPGDAVVNIASGYVPANGVKVYFKTTGTMPTGLVENDIYYIVNSTGPTSGSGSFKVSDDLGGTPKTISAVGTGTITVVIADELLATQYITSYPTVDVNYVLGGYVVTIDGTSPGSGWAIDNEIVIPGNLIGGTTPANDLTLTVNGIDEYASIPYTSYGKVTKFISSGTTPGISDSYYLRVISPTEFAVYSNQQMTIPVSGLTLPFDGIVSTTVTALSGTNITAGSIVGFNVNDAVVFTGNVAGNIVVGQHYYIKQLSPLQISATIGGSAITVGTVASTSFAMAKPGDFALLPEPFYFDRSIVKFNNQAWECIVSNNDTDFVLGKWQLLDSGSRLLNALDRIQVYYAPTDNMPGRDLTQLVSGIAYPNSTYLGNAFAPGEQFPIDTVLPIVPFYPTAIDLTSIAYHNGFKATFNAENSSGIALSPVTNNTWTRNVIAKAVLSLTDIIYAGNRFVVTSNNSATPIYYSTDGVTWTAVTNIADFLNSVTYKSGKYYAAGQNIVSSTNANTWTEVYNFTNNLVNQFNSITNTSLTNFNGVIAVGKGQRYDYSGTLSEIVDTNLITISQDEFATDIEVPYLSYFGLNAVVANSTLIVAAGENGIIYTSTNGTNWNGITEQLVLNTNGATNTLTLLNVSYLTSGDQIKYKGTNFGGLVNGTTYYVGNIDTANNTVKLYTNPSLTISVTLSTGSPIGLATVYRPGSTINDLYFDSYNNIFVAVGNNGLIKTSSNGTIWTTRTSGVTENLFGITSDSNGTYYVVGDNNTIIKSTDTCVTWELDNTFINEQPEYNIQGDPFTFGYGPEELVPGVVTDNVSMLVTTRPGTNWPATEYAHVGYNTVSIELSPTTAIQTVYSFNNVVQTPAEIFVAIMDATTELSTTIYEDIDYTIDWINNTVILNSALGIGQKLRIDVYETGNGDQLVKSSTKSDPIRNNTVTGWDEIYLNCNYTGTIFQGSGIVQPGTQPKSVQAFATEAVTNTITCESVRDFVINDPVRFQGGVIGGLQEDVTYYVKTVSLVSNTITVSLTYNTSFGTAGPTYQLTTATGSFYAIIQIGNGVTYTDPLVYHNGAKMVHGVTGTVTRTKEEQVSPYLPPRVTVNSTAGFAVNSPIVFSDSMFGGVIHPQTVYYIKDIVDNNEFSISTTPGGTALALTNSTGGAEFITNDYAFDLQPNGIQAKMIFAQQYDGTVDYITYTLFGQTAPEQYGYTIPETQVFTGTGATTTFNLGNYISTDSVTNAIVEVDGIRLNQSEYTINNSLDVISFVTAPALNSTIAVTTYNLTERQYLQTQFGITASPGSTTTSVNIRRTTNQNTAYDTLAASINLINGQEYVIETVGTTDYTLVGAASNTVGLTFTAGKSTTAGSFSVNSIYRIATLGSTTYTSVGATEITAGNFVIGEEYIISSVGTTNFVALGASANTVGTIFTATGTGTGSGKAIITIFKASGVGAGTGTATCFSTPGTGTVKVGYSTSGFGGYNLSFLTLASGDTSSLNVNDKISFTAPVLDGLQDGVNYYVTSIIDSANFTVSQTIGGTDLELNNDVGLMASSSNTINVSNITAINNVITPYLAQTNVYTSSSVGNILTCASTGGFVVGQTVQFKVAAGDIGFGGIDVNGKVYYVDSTPSNTEFTIADENGNQITLSTDASPANIMVAFVGGVPAIRVTTGVAHRFETNSLVRIDGTQGSVQLNNNVFYVHVINSTQFDLYEYFSADPTIQYDPLLNAVNYPVTVSNAYTGGGYVWVDGLFVLSTVIASDTTAITNNITCKSGYTTDSLIINTPIYFTESSKQIGDTTLGGIVIGNKYYVKEIVSIDTFTISETIDGAEFSLTTDSGVMNCTQWEQDDVDRLWVTLNGLRVPSSKLRLNPANFVSILTTVVPGDIITITSMMPSATPNEEVFLLNVNKNNEGVVYRANTNTKTWLMEDLYNTSDSIVVGDIHKITETTIQTSTAPAAVDGYRKIGLNVDKNLITSITVYNSTTSSTISSANYTIVIEGLVPVLKITDGAWISTGNTLTITLVTGNTVLVNGEQIKFTEVDIATNTLSGLTRGANGTAVRDFSPIYSEVYGLLSMNQMSEQNYNTTWNPITATSYNTTIGDPLQIANTEAAIFLKQSD